MNKSTAFNRGRGLHGQLLHHLGQLIVSGDLGADGPLVSVEMGEHFGVSRTVLREALRVLEAKGLISARPNVGTRVQPMSDWNLLDPDIIAWRATSSQGNTQHRELSELRCMIEPFAARLAASRQPEELYQELAAAVTVMDRALRRSDRFVFARADAEFHAAVVRASVNRTLEHLSGIVSDGLDSTVGSTQGCQPSQSSLEHHSIVVQAISRRDGAGAEAAMCELLADWAEVTIPGQQA
ncbi:FadR/GntR family transcriptional regulator [Streptomyces sp. NPDC101455]|uniref:FadR/GntR family transcriptional regulator n=1 Tax=Streptomyces sp. NPDC101455 TaxID=3366142 RepID=UPI0037FFDB5F